MKITADDMMRLGIIDEIIREPTGGAHRDPETAIKATGEAVIKALAELRALDRDTVRRIRRDKFISIGRLAV
jgi:acetyl-CoA carboxylase carboxyl transferase subunit alpha